MKYRIRKYVSRTPDERPIYYPQYREHWYSAWIEGKYCEYESDAQLVIDKWIEGGIPEKSKYIKYPR